MLKLRWYMRRVVLINYLEVITQVRYKKDEAKFKLTGDKRLLTQHW